MGTANVIPGVSGGTMAFILGVFEPLIEAIRQIATPQTIQLFLKFKIKELFQVIQWRFLLALGIGVIAAFATTATLCIYLLEHHQAATFAAFFGLVLASIFTMLPEVKCWCWNRWLGLALGSIVAFLLVTLIPVETPNTWYWSFLCGIVVICAMILPGISGSFLLLVLGQYNYVWGAVADVFAGKITLDAISTIFFAGAGCAIGLGSFVYLLKYLLEKWRDVTMATLIGFMVGSLWRLWPWQVVKEYAVKIDGVKQSVSAITAEVMKATGVEVEPLVVANVLPDDFSFYGFFLPVLLAVAGAALVIALEKWASANKKKCED